MTHDDRTIKNLPETLAGMLEMLKVSGLMPND